MMDQPLPFHKPNKVESEKMIDWTYYVVLEPRSFFLEFYIKSCTDTA
jgi:hypothetical protein